MVFDINVNERPDLDKVCNDYMKEMNDFFEIESNDNHNQFANQLNR